MLRRKPHTTYIRKKKKQTKDKISTAQAPSLSFAPDQIKEEKRKKKRKTHITNLQHGKKRRKESSDGGNWVDISIGKQEL